MEQWNIGMMAKKIKCLNPLFHHSIIPIFQFLCFAGKAFERSYLRANRSVNRNFPLVACPSFDVRPGGIPGREKRPLSSLIYDQQAKKRSQA
jgi:hypothetical protein